ncbi:MAG: hypothetical protein H0U79_01585, partial [Solirubrobacterales bacterium]|nr:hypothetical protein [Solirubrobacterales bacterium]
AVAGAAGLATFVRGRMTAVALVLAAVGLTAAPRFAALPDQGRSLAHAARLDADLSRAVRQAGGRQALLSCGRPYVGRYRGPLLAWHLRVPRRRIGFAVRAPGVVFRSRLTARSASTPAVPGGFHSASRTGVWEVLTACGPRPQRTS